MTTVAQPVEFSLPLASKPAWSGAATVAVWGLVALGVVLRIGRWLHWRALWLDEIYLANSILQRSWHDLLFKPLQDWQAAPPAFLVLEHLIADIFGHGERRLRIVSLAFGLASLPLAVAIARRLLSPRAGVLFVALLAVAGPPIYYSNELKPYACDLTCSLAITWAALRLIDEPTRRRAIVAGVIGGLSLLFSYPAIFVLAGAGFVAFVQIVRKKDRWAILRTASVAVVCGLVFWAQYALFIRPFAHGEAHPHLVEYWAVRDAFMPLSPLRAAPWLFTCIYGIAGDAGGLWLAYPSAAAAAVIVGLAVVLKRRDLLLMVLAPLPLVLLASAMRQYPFRDRLAIFFAPQLLLLMGLAIEALWTDFAGKVAALALGAMILIPSAWRSGFYLLHPPGREESLPAYRWIAQQWHPGDRLYLTHFAEPSFHYYQSQAGWPTAAFSADALHVQPACAPSRILLDVRTLSGQSRVWVVAIHSEGGDFDVGQFTIAAFGAIGAQQLGYAQTGASVYLFDCSIPPHD